MVVLPVEGGHGPDDRSISPTGFIDDPPLNLSDDSELYASVFNQENGEHLGKSSQIKNRRSLQAGYGVYPPPPEPAPPHLAPSRMKKGSLTADHHTSRPGLDEAEEGGSQESINRETGWVKNRHYGRDWPENEMYHTYQSDRQKLPPPTKAKPRKPKPKKIGLIHKSGATLPN